MKIVKPGAGILSLSPRPLEVIELSGRTCYKSEGKITEGSAEKFNEMILRRGHLSVIEHASATVKFVCDRGVSHELVRHRLAAFSQESTRYCSYDKGKFGNEVTFIDPRGAFDLSQEEFEAWCEAMEAAERSYLGLRASGKPAEMARSVLPNSLKTEVVMTANFREWRHVFDLRTSPKAHPQMREVMCPLLKVFRANVPVIFDDVGRTEA